MKLPAAAAPGYAGIKSWNLEIEIVARRAEILRRLVGVVAVLARQVPVVRLVGIGRNLFLDQLRQFVVRPVAFQTGLGLRRLLGRVLLVALLAGEAALLVPVGEEGLRLGPAQRGSEDQRDRDQKGEKNNRGEMRPFHFLLLFPNFVSTHLYRRPGPAQPHI